MFNNIFCEMNIKKVIHFGGAGGDGGMVILDQSKTISLILKTEK